MPKDRYRLYHVEKAKGGIALTMTAGSATVSPDSPPVFGNLLAYKDEIVPWMRRLADECHEHGSAVMIQLTHLGRRTAWNKADWLPVLAPSPIREPAHRAFPEGGGGLGHRAHRRRLRRRRRSACRRPGSTGSRSTPTAISGPVLVAGDQQADRRVRRQPGQPACAFTLRSAAGDARRGRPELPARRAHGGRRGLGYRPVRATRASRSPAHAARFRPDRFPQHHPRPYRDAITGCST